MKILVVEDDRRIAGVVRRMLTESGYAVDVATTAPGGIDAFDPATHDLVILDLMLPGRPNGGMDVCREIRTQSADVPVLMLTALNSKLTVIEGLDAGADDYLVKPFHLQEFRARVRALLRRSPQSLSPVIRALDVELDPATRTAARNGRRIELTAKEFAVLEYLMRRAGTIVSASELIDHAWDSNYDGFSNVVQTYVRYLRRKLNEAGETDVIETHRGSGYSIALSR